MGPRRSESSRGRAGIPREFSRPASSSSIESSTIEVWVSVGVSERATLERKARACPGQAQLSFKPRGPLGFIRALSDRHALEVQSVRTFNRRLNFPADRTRADETQRTSRVE